MPLYAASLMDVAKPVEKKTKKQKEKPVEETEKVEEKPVKEVSEKRLAALAKAQETRKRKREEAAAAKAAEEEAIKTKEAEIKAKEEEIVRKKEEMKEKRRLKRESKKQEQTPPASEGSSESTDSAPVKKVRKQKQPRDENTPPAWFQKYVEGVKQEEAKQAQVKVSKKQVEQEARETATQQWQDGFTRDRVQHEVDNHMGRMYSMIFHNRKMK